MTIKAECSDVTDRPLETSSSVRGSRRSILSDDAFFVQKTTNHRVNRSTRRERCEVENLSRVPGYALRFKVIIHFPSGTPMNTAANHPQKYGRLALFSCFAVFLAVAVWRIGFAPSTPFIDQAKAQASQQMLD